MKTEEINRVNRNLARFNGCSEDFVAWYDQPEGTRPSYIVDYTKDLNTLIPIWEKFRLYGTTFKHSFEMGIWQFEIYMKDTRKTFVGRAESLQQAAALATEKAILALEGGK